MQQSHIVLPTADQEALEALLHQSALPGKAFKRVSALLELNKGRTITSVCDILGVCHPTITQLISRYQAQGLACLKDKKQAGRPPRIDGKQRALITALACSPAPEGHAKWTLRLLADKAVELQYCETISHEHVNRILKKTKLSPI
jgi:putative transposase